MSTSLWFIPTHNLSSYENGKKNRHLLGYVGSKNDFENNTPPITGEFIMSAFRLRDSEYSNYILVDEDVFSDICSVIIEDSTALKIEINEDINPKSFNRFHQNIFTLKSVYSSSVLKAYQDNLAFSIVNYRGIGDYYQRGGDWEQIVNELDLPVIKNYKSLDSTVSIISSMLYELKYCRNVSWIFKVYLREYIGSKVNDEAFVASVKDYIRENVPSDNELDFYRHSWFEAFHMSCEEFNNLFKPVEDLEHKNWTAYHFLLDARKRLYLDTSAILKYRELHRTTYLSGVESSLDAYYQIGTKSATFERRIVNTLMLEINALIDSRKREYKIGFVALQICSIAVSLLVAFGFGINSFFLTYILIAVIFQKICVDFFASGSMGFTEDSISDLVALKQCVETSKQRGLWLSSDMARIIQKIN